MQTSFREFIHFIWSFIWTFTHSRTNYERRKCSKVSKGISVHQFKSAASSDSIAEYFPCEIHGHRLIADPSVIQFKIHSRLRILFFLSPFFQ